MTFTPFFVLCPQDLHRTGCSLFCGQSNQAVLKRVLLGYARWNKAVGYCQGFNMLAALILQVMDRNEPDSVKVQQQRSCFILNFVEHSARRVGKSCRAAQPCCACCLPDLPRALRRATPPPQCLRTAKSDRLRGSSNVRP